MKTDLIDNGYSSSTNANDQSLAPLIVVTEPLQCETTNPTEIVKLASITFSLFFETRRDENILFTLNFFVALQTTSVKNEKSILSSKKPSGPLPTVTFVAGHPEDD